MLLAVAPLFIVTVEVYRSLIGRTEDYKVSFRSNYLYPARNWALLLEIYVYKAVVSILFRVEADDSSKLILDEICWYSESEIILILCG